MKNDGIEVLEKNKLQKNSNSNTESGCCGGAPSKNEDACCKLDEDKKAEGESGCGCNTDKSAKKSSCC
ncbi:MAG: hypothetical protein K0S32_1703 [Bacteroidetes bacterium]|jgi:hypothetical protein|nr:hypothetical protein [Bacteroidota bacterium]